VNHHLYLNITHAFTNGQVFCTVADCRGLVADILWPSYVGAWNKETKM